MKDKKKIIELLQKVQQLHIDSMYPGYPFAYNFVIDRKWKKVYIDGCKEHFTLDAFLNEFNQKMIYQSLGERKTQKSSFLLSQKLEKPEYYLYTAEEDSFYIDNLVAVRFYFAVYSAICDKNNNDAIIFGIIDMEGECADLKTFHTLEETKEYINKIWPEVND